MPLMVTGGFRTVDVMAEAVKDGATSVVGLARPFCKDIDAVEQLLAGQCKQLPR